MNTKLIIHNVDGIFNEDDMSYPFKLEMKLSQPPFMNFIINALYGSFEHIVIRGKTLDDIRQSMSANDLNNHPRLISYEITGPDNFIEKVEKRNK